MMGTHGHNWLEKSMPPHYELRQTTHLPHILFVADDLTGAADAGARFAEAGWLTMIALEPAVRVPESDVLVVSTESRDLAQENATAQVRTVVCQTLGGQLEREILHVYKKIDSTLRGHPGPELTAVMDVLNLERALIAPAFPAQGRTTASGRQLVNGVPLEQSAFGCEVPGSDLVAMFQTDEGAPVRLVKLDAVRKGPAAVCEALDAPGPMLVVADAETDADLKTIAQATLNCNVRLCCGSAGLARALVEVLPPPEKRRARPEPAPRPTGAVLVVAGSRNPRTARQVEVAQGWGATLIHPHPGLLEGNAGAIERTTKRASRRLADDENVILTTLNLSDSPLGSHTVADGLAEITRRLVAEGQVGGLVLTGGDIAAATFAAMEASGCWLRGETQPGIAWGVLLDGLCPGLPVVTKAGGFGTDDALATAIRHLLALAT
jgi:uncharacterized protein YgbK (DUF1537 family)